MLTTFHLHGDLASLLRGRYKGQSEVTLRLNRRASVKDVLESFGLPHAEVGSILLNGMEIDYNLIAIEGSVYTVQPVPVPWEVLKPSVLRPKPLATISFLADVNVGRLARYLRAAGFDTLYDHSWRDEYISELLHKEQRILLTRDMRLLMRKHVSYGRYVRATKPVEQLTEVVTLLGLAEHLNPFCRCLDCNTLLEQVAKEDVLHRLEPLTKKYYTTFSRCLSCGKIYWPGSHIEKMRKLFDGR